MALIPPSPTGSQFSAYAWQDWYEKVRRAINEAGNISWSQITDFTGSNLTALATRNHNDLQNIQGGVAGNYWHLPAGGTVGWVATWNGTTWVSQAAGGGGGLTNWAEAYYNTIPNNAIGASQFVPVGGLTNIDAIIQPKGTGGFSTHLADSTTVGGDKIGVRATDTQLNRNSPDQVAAAADSALIAGLRNRIDSSAGAAGCLAGEGNVVTGGWAGTLGSYYCSIDGSGSAAVAARFSSTVGANFSLVQGNANIVNGVNYSGAFGQNNQVKTFASQSYAFGDDNRNTGLTTFTAGFRCVANDEYAQSYGYYSSNRGIKRAWSFSSNAPSAGGSQKTLLTCDLTTTNATVTEFTTDGNPANATNQLYIPNNTAAGWSGKVTARSTTDFKTWKFEGGTANVSGTLGNGTTAPTATVVTATAGAAAWALTFALDTVNSSQQFRGTGGAATTVHWTFVVEDCFVN